jgi:hypothetical protein
MSRRASCSPHCHTSSARSDWRRLGDGSTACMTWRGNFQTLHPPLSSCRLVFFGLFEPAMVFVSTCWWFERLLSIMSRRGILAALRQGGICHQPIARVILPGSTKGGQQSGIASTRNLCGHQYVQRLRCCGLDMSIFVKRSALSLHLYLVDPVVITFLHRSAARMPAMQ